MNESKWSAGCKPTNTIKELFDHLEECFVLAISVMPPHTMDQMIDKAIITVQQTVLYKLVIVKWNGFDANHKTWPDFKAHFGKAYNTRLRSGACTANANGHHGSANAIGATDINSIISISKSFRAIQVAKNANFQLTNDNMAYITQDLQTVQVALIATQQ